MLNETEESVMFDGTDGKSVMLNETEESVMFDGTEGKM